MAGKIVTIDGPAGAGKSTLARMLAAELGFVHFDSGALYRAIALYYIRMEYFDPGLWESQAHEAPLKAVGCDGKTSVYLGDECVDGLIRSTEVSRAVSPVSSAIGVRVEVNARAAAMAQGFDLVADGRDMGSVVFPNAQVKFFLDASPIERARRRLAEELARGRETYLEQVLAEQQARDANDRKKPWGALKVPEGGIVIDTTGLSIPEVLAILIKDSKVVLAGNA
ncbi:MAG: (d)CMP kinase [Candidatus Brocadiia bacterium]